MPLEAVSQESTEKLKSNQLDFTLGYLNKHHEDVLLKMAQVFSPLGAEMAKANSWSGGSFSMVGATITNIDSSEIELQVEVKRRSKPDSVETVQFSLNADPISQKKRLFEALPLVPDDQDRLLIDDVVRRLSRLCWIVEHPEVSGKLIQMAIQLSGKGIGKLPENM